MWNELRYTLKLLLKNTRYSLLCMSVIAVGLGIVLPFYSMIDTSFYQTPRIGQGDRFVTFWKDLANQRESGLSQYDHFHYAFFRDNSTSFQTVKAWRDTSVTVSDGEYAELYRTAEIESGLLQETEATALRGRLLLPDDVLPGALPVALISYSVWQNYYTGREDIIGHQGRINGVQRTIVGVLPQDFGFPINHDVWLPLALPAVANAGEGAENLLITAILREDSNAKLASQEIQLLQAQIKANWVEQYNHIAGSEVLPYIRMIGGKASAYELMILLVAVMLLLMFNIGNLFVARGEERVYELAIRGALGAAPAKIALALMLESFLLCVGGLLAGLVLSYFGISYLGAQSARTNTLATAGFWWEMQLDWRMIAASSFITFAIWFVSGGLPAWRMSRKNLNEVLACGGKGMGDTSGSRLNRILVNLQLVMGCVLLTAGTTVTLIDSNEVMTVVEDSTRFFTGRITMGTRYEGDPEAQQIFRADLTQLLAREDGVQGSGFTTAMPGNSAAQVSYTIDGQDLAVDDLYPRQFAVSVSDNYFELLGLGIVQGRGFDASDTTDSLPVAIVDQRLVEELWPGQSVIGKRIQIDPDDTAQWLTIVGVSAPSRQEASYIPGQAGLPVLYRPINQTNPAAFRVVFKSATSEVPYFEILRSSVARVDRDTAVTDISQTAQDEIARKDVQKSNRFISYALMLISVYLSSIATYGLAARATARRRIETGIRMAVGANRAAALKVFLKDGLKTVSVGLGFGGTLAIVFSYFIMSDFALNGFNMLIQVAVLISLIMGTLVMLANYFPARKIIAMEPADALRYE